MVNFLVALVNTEQTAETIDEQWKREGLQICLQVDNGAPSSQSFHSFLHGNAPRRSVSKGARRLLTLS